MEQQTRVCHRTRHPNWSQEFFFPLEHATPETKFCLSVQNASGTQSSGHVLTTLGYLMEPMTTTLDPFGRWYKLTRKKSSDRISGEVCFIVCVLPKYIVDILKWSEDPATLLDPQMLRV